MTPTAATQMGYQLGHCALRPIPAALGLSRRSSQQWSEMFREASEDPDPANLYMRTFYQMLALEARELALEMQAKALGIRTIYRLEGTATPSIRLLVLMGPGDMLDNTPVDFLLENSDVSLTLLYVLPDSPLPDIIPKHDVAFVALAESDKNNPILSIMQTFLSAWPRPVLNRPEFVFRCARDTAYRLLNDIPGLRFPATQRMARGEIHIKAFPVTIRPVDTHGGTGFMKIDSRTQLEDYLDAHADAAFYLSEFIASWRADGFYRKCRIALIDGTPYACHLAISDDWIVHYFSARMDLSEEKRAEEAAFMENFDTDFGLRHAGALREIARRLELDYVVLDCDETADGQLLLFEADNRSWIHATDPIKVYPYKPPVMQKAFDAFRAMLHRVAAAGHNASKETAHHDIHSRTLK